MSRAILMAKHCLATLISATFLLLSSPLHAAYVEISNVDVGSLKLSGYSVYIKGNNIPAAPTCLGGELNVSIDETIYPGGRAIYSMLFTAQATGRTFTVNFDDTGTICTIRWIRLD